MQSVVRFHFSVEDCYLRQTFFFFFCIGETARSGCGSESSSHDQSSAWLLILVALNAMEMSKQKKKKKKKKKTGKGLSTLVVIYRDLETDCQHPWANRPLGPPESATI